MSKNKDIKALHQWTNKPYRECRAIMKANGWDLYRATGLADLPELINNIFDAFSKTLENITTSLREILTSIDWMRVVELINEAKEENKI